MFYSIALNLSTTTTTSPSSTSSSSSSNNSNNNLNSSNESTKAKLTSNLWLAFNDVRLLLEPSAIAVQAFYTMACYAEVIATPALTWSLLHQAGTMLLALGGALQPSWRLDPATKQRRARMFWRLNVLDKVMALILFRQPMFSQDMIEDVPMPTVNQLVPPVGSAASSRSDAESSTAKIILKADNSGGDGAAATTTPIVFTAHFHNQMHLLSGLMADMWRCLHARDAESVPGIKAELESWHQQAVQVC